MDLLDAVMLCLLVTLGVTTAVVWRSGSERRDVNLLAVLTALWGAGTAAALGW